MPEMSLRSPRKVVLFSGHMIDAPSRTKPRFPRDKEPIAAAGDRRRLGGPPHRA